MLPSMQQAVAERKRAYWRRHALSTCVVLVSCVAISALARPIPASLLLGAFLSGVVIALAEPTADRGYGLLGLLLLVSGITLFTWSAYSAALGKGALLWVQGVGTMFVGALATMAAYGKVRAV